MDRAPLPPHERSWRHPSELGPPEHEPTTTTGHVLIATTALVGIGLIGMLVLTFTPDHSDDLSTAGATTTRAATVAALEQPELPVVTPIGDEGWGVTTTGAVEGRSGMLSARLPSGVEVDVEIVTSDRASGLTVVSLPSREAGYQLADSAPAPSDTVLVDGHPPQVVAMTELAGLDVDEGTPVLDDDGDLVGLCTRGDDHRTALRTVATMPSTPTTAAAAPPPATVASSTSTAAATTAPATTEATTTTSTTVVPTTSTMAVLSTVSDAGASGAPG